MLNNNQPEICVTPNEYLKKIQNPVRYEYMMTFHSGFIPFKAEPSSQFKILRQFSGYDIVSREKLCSMSAFWYLLSDTSFTLGIYILCQKRCQMLR